MIRLRVFHPGRYVWRRRKWRSANALEERWVSFRCVPPNWEKIFGSTLDLLWLPNTRRPGSIELHGQHGFITWGETRRLTKIAVRIEGFSARKESLIVSTLLKAARFHLLEEE
jgi:hypothetical protein